MCGICGFIQDRPLTPDAESVVVAMRDAMSHRGPDGAGVRLGPDYALGHRRLKIVDLSDLAGQPMSNEDKTVWVTFNGEIYNHLELRPLLEAKGHVFRSRSDTEVIVHGWEEWREGVVDRLTGMFAFGLVDEQRGCALLARDRVGIKPLFLFRAEGVLAFASEIKSLLRHPDCPRALHTEVLGEYLTFRNIAGARTLFRGIEQLVPGHRLLLDRDLKGMPRRYWRVQFPGRDDEQTAASGEQFRALMKRSVESHMMSDVPLGMQLSGGLDSSLVSYLASRASPFPLKTFSVGVSAEAYNEFPYSFEVARSIGTDHCAIPGGAEDFDRELDSMVWYMDLPIDHPNSVFLYLLCKRAKQDVTVLLTGEGADELLAGYERYAYYEQVRRKVAALPGWVRRAAVVTPGGGSLRKLRMLRDWARLGPGGMAIRNSAFGTRRMLAMLSRDLAVDLSEREAVLRHFADGEPLETLLRLDQEVYLVSVLHRQDRVSMGASVEARVPFLDHHVIEASNRLPIAAKLAGRGKAVLRRAARGLIPDSVVDRPKMGFPIPIDDWFRGDDRLARRLDLLLEPDSHIASCLDRSGVRRMVDEHRAGARNHSEDLWILLTLELWQRRFLASPAPPREVVRAYALAS
jgi:asparagine synthase (glutamine-hydrolysing)